MASYAMQLDVGAKLAPGLSSPAEGKHGTRIRILTYIHMVIKALFISSLGPLLECFSLLPQAATASMETPWLEVFVLMSYLCFIIRILSKLKGA